MKSPGNKLSLLQQCVLEGFKKKFLYGHSNDPMERKKNGRFSDSQKPVEKIKKTRKP
jgi:hypothetical protein